MSNYRPKSCSVTGCKDRVNPRHRFPKNDEDTFKTWVEVVNHPRFSVLTPQEIYDRYCVCHRHFAEETLVKGTKRGLKVGSIPTLYMPDDIGRSSKSVLKNGSVLSSSLSECTQITETSEVLDSNTKQLDNGEMLTTDTSETDSDPEFFHNEMAVSADEEVNNQHLRNTRPPNSAPNKRKLENELLITSSRKQMRTLGSFNQNTCIDLDTSKSMKMFKLVPVDAVIDSRVPDLLREPQIEIVYLPTTKEDESDVQSENLASLSEETFPEETCPDVSCERDSILPHDLPPPQNYDPSCDFVPKQMYMELKFNYMDVLSRIRKLEKNARESDEERKELRTENYRLIYELKKLKNSYNLQSKKLSEEAEKCNANVFVVTGNKVTLKKNILSDW